MQPADAVHGADVEVGQRALAAGKPALGAGDRLVEQREAELGILELGALPGARMAAAGIKAPER